MYGSGDTSTPTTYPPPVDIKCPTGQIPLFNGTQWICVPSPPKCPTNEQPYWTGTQWVCMSW
jgi:hypothetical protein